MKKHSFYRPSNRSSCGVGLYININNIRSHEVVQNSLEVLSNLKHRGAVGADEAAGDGAGIMTHIPDQLFRSECPSLPALGDYIVGMFFIDTDDQDTFKRGIASIAKKFELNIAHIRNVPSNPIFISEMIRS